MQPILITSLVAHTVKKKKKNTPATWETTIESLGWEDPLEGGNGSLLQYAFLENPHGQRSLAGYSPWGQKEVDTAEQ